jgi:7-cyano-7-deazaguanine synthase
MAIAAAEGYELFALSLLYGQKNTYELGAAKALATYYQAREHLVVSLDLGAIGGSSLTTITPVETNRSLQQIGVGIPSTYVPARNTLFLSYALAWADSLSCANIFIGVNAVDTSGYPDCRPEFIAAFTRLANLATRLGTEGATAIRIHAPLQEMSKAQIIETGIRLGVPYQLTSTCYDPQDRGVACGQCDACILRLQGFSEAGRNDPVEYLHK